MISTVSELIDQLNEAKDNNSALVLRCESGNVKYSFKLESISPNAIGYAPDEGEQNVCFIKLQLEQILQYPDKS